MTLILLQCTANNLGEEIERRICDFHLQYLVVFLNKGELKRENINLIGRDCDNLDREMVGVLTTLRDKLPAEKQALILPVIELWTLWRQAAKYLWLQRATAEQAKQCGEIQERFFQHLVKNLLPKDITWYMHTLRDHVPTYTQFLQQEFGWGYGMMTGQSMEHKLKLFKRYASAVQFQS